MAKFNKTTVLENRALPLASLLLRDFTYIFRIPVQCPTTYLRQRKRDPKDDHPINHDVLEQKDFEKCTFIFILLDFLDAPNRKDCSWLSTLTLRCIPSQIVDTSNCCFRLWNHEDFKIFFDLKILNEEGLRRHMAYLSLIIWGPLQKNYPNSCHLTLMRIRHASNEMGYEKNLFSKVSSWINEFSKPVLKA